MASDNLYRSGYFGSSPPAGGGGYQSGYSSPYNPLDPQGQYGGMAPQVTPTKVAVSRYGPYNHHNQSAGKNVAPINPYYNAPKPAETAPSLEHRQFPINAGTLLEAYRAIDHLTALGALQKKDCQMFTTCVEVPTWLYSETDFKVALVIPGAHSFHGIGAEIPVDLKDIELGIWQGFEDKLVRYSTRHCLCYVRKNDPWGITASRDPFIDPKKGLHDIWPEQCAFCTLERHLEKVRNYVESLEESMNSPPAFVVPAPAEQSAPPQRTDVSVLKREKWYWIESAKVHAFFYGSLPPHQARQLAANWNASARDFAGSLDEMTIALGKAVDEMWFHLYMGILVPLCHRWCSQNYKSFQKFSTKNAGERRKFWRLRMIEERDCVEKWLECLDVLLDIKASRNNRLGDTHEDVLVKSRIKMWTDRHFLMSMDLVFTEIVIKTYLQGHDPQYAQNTRNVDFGNYAILKSKPYKFVGVVNDADVKQFEVGPERWYTHKHNPATGLAAHQTAAQIIANSCHNHRFELLEGLNFA